MLIFTSFTSLMCLWRVYWKTFSPKWKMHRSPRSFISTNDGRMFVGVLTTSPEFFTSIFLVFVCFGRCRVHQRESTLGASLMNCDRHIQCLMWIRDKQKTHFIDRYVTMHLIVQSAVFTSSVRSMSLGKGHEQPEKRRNSESHKYSCRCCLLPVL